MESFDQSFQIISEAGDARTKANEAIRAAEKGKFLEAENLLKDAKECMRKAHQIQTDMIHQEVTGQRIEVTILLVHAQDHFSMASTAIDTAEYLIRLLKRIDQLEKGEN